MTRPLAGATAQEPTFGTKIQALPAGLRHEYSQLQAWSPDEKHLLLRDLKTEAMHVINTKTLARVAVTIQGSSAKWLPDGRVLSWLAGPPRILATSLDGQTEEILKLSYPGMNNGAAYEEVSRDGRWTAGLVENDGKGQQRILLIDLKSRKVAVDTAVTSLCGGQGYPDWVAPSPMGRYLVIQWAADGKGRCRGMEVYDTSGQRVRQIHQHHHHSSLGVAADGREYVMTYEDYHPSNPNHPSIVRYMLDDAKREDIRMIPWGRFEHVSCEGAPGSPCVVSAGYEFPNNQPLLGEVYLVNQDGSLLRLAHHRSKKCGEYYAQPHASISPTGRKIAFSSDWGQGCGAIGGFTISL